MSNHNGERSFWSFWTTLPGVLSGLAALITAVGGLTTAIYLVTSSGNSSNGPPPPTTAIRPTPQVPNGAPVPAPVSTNGVVSPPTSLPRTGELQLKPGITEGAIGPGEKIVHWFHVPNGGRAEVNIEASGGTCIHLTLLDRAREPIEESPEECGVFGYFAVLANEASGGAYYLEVESGSSVSAGNYTVQLLSQTQDDAGSGGDAGPTLDTSVLLEAPLTRQGLVGSQDPEDFYRFRADGNTVLEVQYATWDQLEVRLLTVDASGRITGEVAVRRDQPVDFSQRPAGEYALRILNQGIEAGYTIILGVKSGL